VTPPLPESLLSDDELRARLHRHGAHPAAIEELVAERDTAEAAATIDDILQR